MVTLDAFCRVAELFPSTEEIFRKLYFRMKIFSVPATAQYPIITGGTLAFSAILGFICYKEKLGIIEIIRVAVVISATILFMF